MEDKPILILACSGSKVGHEARAIDIYAGTLFRRGRAYAERHNLPVLILSAKFGFVQPTQVLPDYNQRFTSPYTGPFPPGHGFYLGGQDYFGNAPERFQPLIPSDRIGKMVFYMEQLEVLGRLELFRRFHVRQRGVQEALASHLQAWRTPEELVELLNHEFGALPSFPDTVKQALRPSGLAKATGKTLERNGSHYALL